MAKLKLGPVLDEKPVRLTIELPAVLFRDLADYASILAQTTGKPAPEPSKLVPPIIQRFIATDREFLRARRQMKPQEPETLS